MFVRVVTVATTLLVAWPALAEPLDVDAARRFVVGKTFAYNCFDGTRGAGRIQSDLSVAGTIQIRGAGPVRFVTAAARHAQGQRPVGLRVRARHSVGAVLQSSTRPHQELPRLGRRACNFAYCDFTRRGPRRPSVAHDASDLAAAVDPGGRARRPATDKAPRTHPLGAAPISGAVAFRAGNSRRW